MSSAAKREDIQKRLQDLRAQKQKEKEAFDQLAAENEGLSAEEIATLARQHAEKAAVETSITVNGGAQVAVGDSVTVCDDNQRLLRSERGLLAPDAIKRVYLGETGKVLRVWSDFQGKPAVELRFADTCTKVFFAECLDLPDTGAAPTTTTAKPASPTAAAHNGGARPDRPRTAEPAGAAPAAAVAPSWGSLSLPGKSKPAVKEAACKPGAPSSAAPPLAPPVVPAPAAAADAPAPVPTIKLRPTSRPVSTAAASDKPSAAQVTSPPADPSSVTSAPVAPVEPPPTAPVTAAPPATHESLGNPTPDLVLEAAQSLGDSAKVAAEMDNLLQTPRPDFLAASNRSPVMPRLGSPVSPQLPSPSVSPGIDAGSCIPVHCPANYQPKFPLHDPESGIPRCPAAVPPPAAVRTVSGGSLVKRADSPRVTSSTSSVAPRTPKRDVARPLLPVRTGGATRIAPRTGSPITTTTTATTTTTGTSGAARPSSVGRRTPKPATTAARAPGAAASFPLASAAAAGVPGQRKTIQVRVFENGLYDNDAYDRVYRTVTIRPTYKSVATVRSMIGRELLWRDGRKVEFLFDASGAEIEDVNAIQDGQSLIASAGDRFVIPFPNSSLHAEALRLSQQQS